LIPEQPGYFSDNLTGMKISDMPARKIRILHYTRDSRRTEVNMTNHYFIEITQFKNIFDEFCRKGPKASAIVSEKET
jgi:hypothetical protein